jgi:hypothetical protein
MKGTPELPDELRCEATHTVYSGRPHKERCTGDKHKSKTHVDRDGRVWRDEDA